MLISVVGGGNATPEAYKAAEQVGKELARRGVTVVCGGLGGVMEAVCKGAREAGGHTIGILPGGDPAEANPYVEFPIATGLGYARNVIVVRAMADHLRTELVLDALHMAVGQRRPCAGALVHPTDRGCQYTAPAYRTGRRAYQAALAALSISCSMRRAGNCYDNAVAESFFATLKNELVERHAWATRREAREAIFEWIAVFYNRQRRHSALGYRSPVEFEETLLAAEAA